MNHIYCDHSDDDCVDTWGEPVQSEPDYESIAEARAESRAYGITRD